MTSQGLGGALQVLTGVLQQEQTLGMALAGIAEAAATSIPGSSPATSAS